VPQPADPPTSPPPVLACRDPAGRGLAALVGRYGLRLQWVGTGEPIPGSHWGEPEAGLVGDRLLVRGDTPIHSALHEACHWICMDAARRETLHTDAGGDYAEEDGVCYLQVVLAGHLEGMGRDRMLADMDAWGYSFRLGSAGAWFRQDAEEARRWLRRHDLLDPMNRPTWRPRT